MSGGRTPRRMVYVRWLVALLSPALLLAPAAAQDRAPVPGEVDAQVTQSTIRTTICEHGYTTKVRPPRKVTDAVKRRLVNGLPGSLQDYELDHLIPLGLGGHPTSANNLPPVSPTTPPLQLPLVLLAIFGLECLIALHTLWPNYPAYVSLLGLWVGVAPWIRGAPFEARGAWLERAARPRRRRR